MDHHRLVMDAAATAYTDIQGILGAVVADGPKALNRTIYR